MLRARATRVLLAALALTALLFVYFVVNRKPAADASAGVDCEQARDKCACIEKQAAEALLNCWTERALALAAGAAQTCGSNTQVIAIQSEALAASGHHAAAKTLAGQILKANPQNRFARRALGISAIAERDFVQADAVLGGLIAEDANDAGAVYYAALAAARRDRYNDARQGFLRALRLHKRHIDARYNLVLLTSEAGAHEEAAHHLERLKEIAPSSDARVSSAQALVNARSGAPNSPVTLVREQRDAG